MEYREPLRMCGWGPCGREASVSERMSLVQWRYKHSPELSHGVRRVFSHVEVAGEDRDVGVEPTAEPTCRVGRVSLLMVCW